MHSISQTYIIEEYFCSAVENCDGFVLRLWLFGQCWWGCYLLSWMWTVRVYHSQAQEVPPSQSRAHPGFLPEAPFLSLVTFLGWWAKSSQWSLTALSVPGWARDPQGNALAQRQMLWMPGRLGDCIFIQAAVIPYKLEGKAHKEKVT